MKKALLALIVCLGVACVGTVNAGDWYYLATDSDNHDFFADKSTMSNDGNVAVFWIVSVNIDPKLPYDSTVTLQKLNRENRTIQFLTYKQYLKGEEIYSENPVNQIEYVIPGSMGQEFYDFAFAKKGGDFISVEILDKIDFPGHVAKVVQPLMRADEEKKKKQSKKP